MRIRIENGTIVTADATLGADLLIDGETIAAIGERIEGAADLVLDATGKLVLPGGVDAHTHLDMPLDERVRSADDFESGTIAAAVGGTTTIVDYATQARGGSLGAALETWLDKARGRAVVDYGFHMIVCDLTLRGRARARRDGRGGRAVVQALHGLPGPPDARRRRHLPGPAARARERRPGLPARRERPRHPGAGRARARRRADGAARPRRDPAGARRGGGGPARGGARRDRRRAGLHRPPLLGRGPRGGRARPRPRRRDPGRDLPAVPLPLRGALRRARLRAARAT